MATCWQPALARSQAPPAGKLTGAAGGLLNLFELGHPVLLVGAIPGLLGPLLTLCGFRRSSRHRGGAGRSGRGGGGMRRAGLLVALLASMLGTSEATAHFEDVVAHYSRRAHPVGGRVTHYFRFDLDLNDDGVPEIFLSDNSSYGKSGSVWLVYSPTDSTFHFLGRVLLHEDSFWFDSDRSILGVLQPVQISVFRLVRYRITADGIHEVENRRVADMIDGEIVEETARIRERIEVFRESASLTVVRATPEEVRRGQEGEPVVWTDIRTGGPVYELRPLSGGPPAIPPPVE